MIDLIDHANSGPGGQYGEGPILRTILERLNIPNAIGLEYGGGYDFDRSNIGHVCVDGLFIEESRDCATRLREGMSSTVFDVIETRATLDGTNTPEAISDRCGVRPDIISIDVDGDDWMFFLSHTWKPPVYVVEYNPTIPYNINARQNIGQSVGASALSIHLLGALKGYTLACMTQTNCIMVRDDLHDQLELTPRSFAWHYFTANPMAHSCATVSTYRGEWFFLYDIDHLWGVEGMRFGQGAAAHLFERAEVWETREQVADLFEPIRGRPIARPSSEPTPECRPSY